LLSLVLFTILSFNTAFMATSKDPAATAADGAVEKLYEYGDRLSESGDKSKNEADYIGIIAAAKGSSKAKQLAAQLIPRFFKYFPSLSAQAINAQLDLCEEDELGVGSATTFLLGVKVAQ
jgi:hypothetical protein